MDAHQEKPAAKKSGKRGMIVAIGVLLGTTAVAGIGGAFVGPMLAPPAAADEKAHGADEHEEPEVTESIKLDPIVVDLRHDGAVRHLKVGLSLEPAHTGGGHGGGGIEPYLPRGREAAITYLRSLTFDEATNPKAFERIRGELEQRIIAAIGKSRVGRIVVTDYVAQ